MKIEFFEICTPPKTSHHAKRIVHFKGRDGKQITALGDTPQLQAAKNQWDSIFLLHRPEKPFDEPIQVNVTLYWPWNVGDSKKVRALGRTWHATKPDIDNACKGILDSMARCSYFTQDSKVVELRMEKYRGDKPGIYVLIEPAGEV